MCGQADTKAHGRARICRELLTGGAALGQNTAQIKVLGGNVEALVEKWLINRVCGRISPHLRELNAVSGANAGSSAPQLIAFIGRNVSRCFYFVEKGNSVPRKRRVWRRS
jgi:hypothetical protein